MSGLARRVHDNSTLKQEFDNLVHKNTTLEGFKAALAQRVPTRWNSDFDCLIAHLHFRTEVEKLTGVTANRLQAYRLTNEQWNMAEDLRDALQVCQFPLRLS